MRIVAVAYYALVPAEVFESSVGRPARVHVEWEDEAGGTARALDDAGVPLPLAFDHATMVGTAVQRIRGKLRYAPVAFELLPPEFTARTNVEAAPHGSPSPSGSPALCQSAVKPSWTSAPPLLAAASQVGKPFLV